MQADYDHETAGLVPCPVCGYPVSSTAPCCPHCGEQWAGGGTAMLVAELVVCAVKFLAMLALLIVMIVLFAAVVGC